MGRGEMAERGCVTLWKTSGSVKWWSVQSNASFPHGYIDCNKVGNQANTIRKNVQS